MMSIFDDRCRNIRLIRRILYEWGRVPQAPPSGREASISAAENIIFFSERLLYDAVTLKISPASGGTMRRWMC
jgi:hypothetical protein